MIALPAGSAAIALTGCDTPRRDGTAPDASAAGGTATARPAPRLDPSDYDVLPSNMRR